MHKKTVLVTGATGFLGGHILRAFMFDPNIRLIAACRHSEYLPDDYNGEIRSGDLENSYYIKQLVEGVDIVCHAAAWTSLWGHEKWERQRYLKPSVELIQHAVIAGVERFLFASTVTVCGVHAENNSVSAQAIASPPQFWPHLQVVAEIEQAMREQAGSSTTMITLRCGHFAGQRYNLGLLSILIPRLKTHLVPWIDAGRARLPIVDGRDLGHAFYLASIAAKLNNVESFNICANEFPSMKQVIEFIHEYAAIPRPHFNVTRKTAYRFAWLMEKLNRIIPGDPFLTRAIVYLSEDWYAPDPLAHQRLGYQAQYSWQSAIAAQLDEMKHRPHSAVSLVDGKRWWAR